MTNGREITVRRPHTDMFANDDDPRSLHSIYPEPSFDRPRPLRRFRNHPSSVPDEKGRRVLDCVNALSFHDGSRNHLRNEGEVSFR
jgi:hypothetical protein